MHQKSSDLRKHLIIRIYIDFLRFYFPFFCIHWLMDYDLLLLGSSTWGAGDLQDDWYSFVDQLKNKDLTGKRVALFGCGDSASYPDTFCDALSVLYDDLAGTGCAFVGAYVPEDYDVTDSAVCRDGKFIGLAIDDVNESDKTEDRIDTWIANF